MERETNGTTCESNDKSKGGLITSTTTSTRKAIVILVSIFLVSILCLCYVYTIFPELEESEKSSFKLPRNIEDAKSLGNVLSRYKEKYFTEVLGGVFVIYIL